jgi:uncharacterized membrane protein
MNTISHRAIKLFTVGLFCFGLGLFFCMILKPKGLGLNDGISYYGNYRLTILPYVVAIIGYGLFTLLVARSIKNDELWPLKYGLYLFALLCLIITLTPDNANHFLDITHTTVGSILFVLQLSLSGWLIFKLRFKAWSVVFASAEFLSGVACAFYIPGHNGFLIQAQIIFQLFFAALMYLALSSLRINSTLAD